MLFRSLSSCPCFPPTGFLRAPEHGPSDAHLTPSKAPDEPNTCYCTKLQADLACETPTTTVKRFRSYLSPFFREGTCRARTEPNHRYHTHSCLCTAAYKKANSLIHTKKFAHKLSKHIVKSHLADTSSIQKDVHGHI